MAATTFAMDSVSKLAAQMADRGGYDIRLEAAAAKEWNSVRAWEMIDQTLQIRGGRGYETEVSLAGRGETPVAVEGILRDCRINLIFEGSSEVMHLFMAREAVDKHLQVAGAMIDPKNGFKEKMAALPKILGFYAGWYPPLWLRGLGTPGRYSEFGDLAPHLRFVERSARKLARESFHAMAIFHAKSLVDSRAPDAEGAQALADLFCRNATRKVQHLFRDLWRNDDDRKNGVA